MSLQYCYNVINQKEIPIKIDSDIVSDIKTFITDIYINSEYKDLFTAKEKIPFVVIYSEKNKSVCISLTSKSKKILEAVDNIHKKLNKKKLKVSDDINLSEPFIFGTEESKWWENENICKLDGKRWLTLEHNGPYFTHIFEPYEPLGAYLIYNGKKYKLNPSEEIVAGFYAKRLISEENPDITIYHTKDKVFNNNFFKDFKEYLTPTNKEIFKSFDKIDFSDIIDKIKLAKDESKSKDKVEKKAKTEQKKMDYGYAILDGKREKVGNFVIEPAGIFMGRGLHPNRGKIKKNIEPEDVIINIGNKDKIPKAPKGHKWKSIVHDHDVEWINKWTDPISGDVKYTRFSNEGKFKGECDIIKYDKARKLNDNIDHIKEKYIKDASSSNKTTRQLGTVLYLIDEYGLRVGGDKTEEEADTVGASTLKVGNITITPPNLITFDFLGKDSIRFYKELKVPEIIYNNFKDFIKGKSDDNEIFNLVNASTINDYLKSFDKDFTAKVFRTRLASSIMYTELSKLKIPKDSNKSAVRNIFNKANKSVAVVLNHTRTVSKKNLESVDKLNDELDSLKKELKKAKKEGNSTKSLDSKIDTLEKKIEAKSDTMSVAITTSLTNYIDPRLVISWCKKNDITSDYIYTNVLLKKFKWADEITDKKWDYIKSPNVLGKELQPRDGESRKIDSTSKPSKSISPSKSKSTVKTKSPSKTKQSNESISPSKTKQSDESISPSKTKQSNESINLNFTDLDISIKSYSDKSIVVLGNTKIYIEELKEIGGKWNPNLKIGPGWIFSLKKLDDLVKLFNKKIIKSIKYNIFIMNYGDNNFILHIDSNDFKDKLKELGGVYKTNVSDYIKNGWIFNNIYKNNVIKWVNTIKLEKEPLHSVKANVTDKDFILINKLCKDQSNITILYNMNPILLKYIYLLTLKSKKITNFGNAIKLFYENM